MTIGKVPNKLLEELVLRKMGAMDDRVLLAGGIGEDFGALDFGGDCCIISSDPITGATRRAGTVAVHVACNDIATCGARPIALLTTILLPPAASEADLGALADEIAAAAGALGVSVIGGHTEVTDAVNRIVISATALGAA
ncbi:MAG: AIR synthase related protein, partial [Oscillospiraceae bacterium]|nr:AIR synthase related protein [Oscillospiraceae bacterium]